MEENSSNFGSVIIVGSIFYLQFQVFNSLAAFQDVLHMLMNSALQPPSVFLL